MPLSVLTDVGTSRRSVPNGDAEKIMALVLDKHRPAQLRRGYEVLRAILGKK